MTRFASLLLLVLCCGMARGQWYEYSPAGAVNGPTILEDILSRCDEQGRRIAWDSSKVTYTHELSHQLNSRIRNLYGGSGKINAFYVGGGVCCVLPEPRITLAIASQYVPQQVRNSTYQLYFVTQRQYWDNEPLYIMDEFSAYVNGTQHANESGDDPHGTHDRAIWFCSYADAVVEATERHDPQYQKLAELKHFVAWQKERVRGLVGNRGIARLARRVIR